MSTAHARLRESLASYLHTQAGTIHADLEIGGLRADLVIELASHSRIAVHILDGSIGPREMTLKVRGYFDNGIREAWLIDPEDESVEVWNTPWQPLQLTDDDAISTELMPGFSLPLAELFAV